MTPPAQYDQLERARRARPRLLSGPDLTGLLPALLVGQLVGDAAAAYLRGHTTLSTSGVWWAKVAAGAAVAVLLQPLFAWPIRSWRTRRATDDEAPAA